MISNFSYADGQLKMSLSLPGIGDRHLHSEAEGREGRTGGQPGLIARPCVIKTKCLPFVARWSDALSMGLGNVSHLSTILSQKKSVPICNHNLWLLLSAFNHKLKVHNQHFQTYRDFIHKPYIPACVYNVLCDYYILLLISFRA